MPFLRLRTMCLRNWTNFSTKGFIPCLLYIASGVILVTHGRGLGYKFASQQPSLIRNSSSHHALEGDWCRFLDGFVVLLHKWRYILTSQTNWCNCRQLLERKIKNSVQNQWLSKESTHDL